MIIKELVEEFYVEKESLTEFLLANKIEVLNNDLIPDKFYEKVLSFIENQGNRIEKALNGNIPNFSTSDNSVKVYRDDAISFLEKLPSSSIDIIVTDPAYSGMNTKLKLGKGRIVGQYSDKGKENGKWFGEFEDSLENYSKFLTQCKRVLKKSTGHIYIMFDSYSLLSLGHIVRNFFDVKNLITWDKVNIGMGHYYRRRHEYIIFATNGNTRKIRNRTFPDVWQIKRIHNSKYPTQKPVELFQTMIFASAEENYTVCDPFLGSASSAIAAIKNNCKFIGCDISDKSIEISKKRIIEYKKNGIDLLQPNSETEGKKILWK